MKDVIIIGGGVIGTSIARELSKYELDILLLEKNDDLASGVSKANSGIIHAGFNENSKSLKAKLNILGNSMFDDLSRNLDFSFKRNGAMVLAFNNEDLYCIKQLKKNGESMGIGGLSILSREEILEIEENISGDVVGALYARTSGIVNPYEMTVALGENANLNGVEFKFHSEVLAIEEIENGYKLELGNGAILETKVVINAAGINGDDVNNMINKEKYKVKGVKGEYILLDKIAGNIVNHTLFQTPSKVSKGVLVTNTLDGNLLIGPNANLVNDKNNVSTTKNGISEIIQKSKKCMKSIPFNRVLNTFSGVRPHIKDDFIIEEVDGLKNFINVIGIDSPGLTAAPAIAVYVKDILSNNIDLVEKKDFNPIRKGVLKFNDLDIEDKNKIIKDNPKYGRLICKCEMITEGEIVDVIRRPLGAKTVDGVKRRTRATMGGCQGVGCIIPISKIISRELNIDLSEVMKNNKGSNVIGYKEAQN